MVRSEGGLELAISDRKDLVSACSRMGMCSEELIKGFEFIYDDLMYLFKHYHNKYLLSEHLDGIPYHIPQWLGGLGLAVGYDPAKQINDSQLKAARVMYQEYSKLKPNKYGTTAMCLFDELVNRRQDFLMSQADICKEERKVDFQTLETEGGSRVDLLDENQKVYTDTIEYYWRTFTLPQFFNQADASYLDLMEKAASKKLYRNSALWKSCFQLGRGVTEPLQWYKLWHQPQNDLRPIVRTDASRANREYILTLLGCD
jgi:hypothetical protein